MNTKLAIVFLGLVLLVLGILFGTYLANKVTYDSSTEEPPRNNLQQDAYLIYKDVERGFQFSYPSNFEVHRYHSSLVEFERIVDSGRHEIIEASIQENIDMEEQQRACSDFFGEDIASFTNSSGLQVYKVCNKYVVLIGESKFLRLASTESDLVKDVVDSIVLIEY